MIEIQDAVVRKHQQQVLEAQAAADARRAAPSVFKASLSLETPSETRSFSLSTQFFPFIRPILFIFPGRFFSVSSRSLRCVFVTWNVPPFLPDLWIICWIFLHFSLRSHRGDWMKDQHEHRQPSRWRLLFLPLWSLRKRKRRRNAVDAYLWGGISWRPPPCQQAAGGSLDPGPGLKQTLPGRRHDDPGTAVQPPDESRPVLKQEKNRFFFSR